ncbi:MULTISPECIES: NAD(P)/FAD-dependent oxidoreductase [unclassified Streptomyces]|uniref:NAD(P)/FAD-dependent oxidoreductase n=1 Tax=unclassified Streptomyces TaxID=2593676 RepID=UPI00093D2734|nr:NAD(P)/FAD-dependent oxidoreductase [Streptomyces sp. CB02058]OKI85803.1 FAD-dependent oxidoreductase [Streptomyces sp. CB02058]
MYDVIVVGARCAGASTALLLARAGHRVLMVDRATFPRDTLSTLYIHQPGVARLAQWGVLDDIVATGAPALDRVTYRVADVELSGCSWPVAGQRAAYAPRRHHLDTILARAAVAAGAEFREGCTVEDVLFEDDRVVGVRCRTSGGAVVEERAALVVGADGMRSRVAEAVKAPLVAEDPLMTCAYYTYWEGVSDHFELHETPGRWIGVIPTNDGLTLVASYFPQAEFNRVRADVGTAYLDAVRTTAPTLYDRMAGREQADKFYGSGDQRNFFRRAAGPGWALVGDAAHHKDSITAKGITDAFLQAEALAGAVGEDLREPARLEEALRTYAEGHEDLLVDGYQSTLFTAALTVRKDRLAMLRAVASKPEFTERYFAAVAGDCATEDLYTPDLLDLLY